MKSINRYIILLACMLLVACGVWFWTKPDATSRCVSDLLNDYSYDQHYRNLDTTLVYAQRAYEAANGYRDGQAEALNNMVFVSIARMNYQEAYQTLEKIKEMTDNQLELLVADVQLMRLSQRESQNRDFYGFMQSAQRRLQRIAEERDHLTERQKQRLAYAESEFNIVVSTYYYYLGLYDLSAEAIMSLAHNEYLEQDTAQMLNYYYVIGSGGIIRGETHEAVSQQEFDYLMRCLLSARQKGYPYWEANSLQAISEHIQNPESREKLLEDNLPAFKFINPDNLPEEWLAGNLASKALEIFSNYGDVYQTAGACRTIAQCDWELQEYGQAINHLNEALTRNVAIEQAPDLVASIREQLALAYAAIDDKPNSDYNRNLYLDLQEQTRQDRQLEARAEQLKESSVKLNTMISAVLLAILITIVLFIIFAYMRRQSDRKYSITSLLQPLSEWTRKNDAYLDMQADKMENVEEQTVLVRRQVELNRKCNLEQRAKVALVNSVMPLIDRILHEIKQLLKNKASVEKNEERYAYIAELTDQINEYNGVLTKWIQMRQGELSLHIESFPLQDLFQTLQRGRMSFLMKGITLDVQDTPAVVKADKTLSLFMLNTIADNARKFTPQGGSVTVSAEEKDEFVEVSITDTGIGMSEEEQQHVFDHKPLTETEERLGTNNERTSHGFGLMNCKGIIEKYRKVSRIFSVCDIGVESTLGQGSRFFFRLPKGVIRAVVLLLTAIGWGAEPMCARQADEQLLDSARMVADSVYFSNIKGNYEAAIEFASQCIDLLNRHHQLVYPDRQELMETFSDRAGEPAELIWLHKQMHTDYNVILDMRNEMAIAAMALHDWPLYHYSNRVYTQLFRERSADPTLADYVKTMQLSEANKNVAVALLVILLLLLFPAYYFLYYRHSIHYRFLIERVKAINQTLLSEQGAQEKLHAVDRLWSRSFSENKELEALVERIRHSLEQAIDSERASNESIEFAQDELRKAIYENDRLHVANSVLDNCLSTLKHETMYYPSRIKLLIENKDATLDAVDELSRYYKELYATLAAQANRQVETPLHVDAEMLEWLFELLTRLNNGHRPEIIETSHSEGYVRLNIRMSELSLSSEQCQNLFTPMTIDADYLLCRQMVRELGEETNARACGILAHLQQEDGQGIPIIEITITEKIWKNSKLSL